MSKVILTIGILLILLGLWILIRPQFIRKAIHVLAKGPLVYIPAAVRVVLGVVFLLAARETRVTWLIVAVGVFMFATGIIMFMLKAAKLRDFLGWWANRSLVTLRIMGVVLAVVGGIVAWAV